MDPSSVFEYWEGAPEEKVREEFKKRWPEVLATYGGVGAMRKKIIATLMEEFDAAF